MRNSDANEEIDGDTCDTAEPPLVCGWCGDTVETLIDVEDYDNATGYRETLMLCERCENEKRSAKLT